ncbi:MAG: hypothetical protein HZB21_07035 [Deltaproteobacteria bacterium]|nr:hypothetical protein [Deltaproteobacteria bacterium]
MAAYAFTWKAIPIKMGGDAGKGVTSADKEMIINNAVSKWKAMGLSQEYISFGIATMNIDSGFNPYARSGSKTEYGLGQFRTDTWDRAVERYNTFFGGDINKASDRSDIGAQIAVMGAWIGYIRPIAERRADNPAFNDRDVNEIAYGLWHGGANAESVDVESFLQENFDRKEPSFYFHNTVDQVNAALEMQKRFGAPNKGGDFVQYHNLGAHSGESLRREGNQVYRIEKDGGIRGYFVSE